MTGRVSLAQYSAAMLAQPPETPPPALDDAEALAQRARARTILAEAAARLARIETLDRPPRRL